MNFVTMRDLEDSTSAINGVARSADEIVTLLEAATRRAPFFCALESHGHALLVGVGRDCGCAQHSSEGRQPPYFMAVASRAVVATDLCQFLSGGQRSDVPQRYCLAWSELRKIIEYFVGNDGKMASAMTWEQI
jgi:hypothetical protein